MGCECEKSAQRGGGGIAKSRQKLKDPERAGPRFDRGLFLFVFLPRSHLETVLYEETKRLIPALNEPFGLEKASVGGPFDLFQPKSERVRGFLTVRVWNSSTGTHPNT